MRQYEFLKATASILHVLEDNKIDARDIKYLELYEDFTRLKSEGHKISYIVEYLSEQYECGVATVYRIIKRMEQNLK